MMLTNGDISVPVNVQRCVDCDKPIPRTGKRGPLKRRCDDCRYELFKATQRAKRATAVPLGSEIACEACGTGILRSGGNKHFCKECAGNRRRRNDLRRYYERQGRDVVSGAGSEIACEQCGESIIKTRSDKKYCSKCLRNRLYEYIRRTQEARRREAGVPLRAGVEIKCAKCSILFIRQSTRGKYCRKCKTAPQINWISKKIKTDPLFALNHWASAAVRKCLSGRKGGRSWESLVGYTADELKRHIERQFLPGMSWENRGKWHADHVVPLSSFKFASADDPEFRAAWALSNLRPLWAKDNLEKRAKRLHLI